MEKIYAAARWWWSLPRANRIVHATMIDAAVATAMGEETAAVMAATGEAAAVVSVVVAEVAAAAQANASNADRPVTLPGTVVREAAAVAVVATAAVIDATETEATEETDVKGKHQNSIQLVD